LSEANGEKASRLFQEIKLFSEIISFRYFSKTLAAKSLGASGILHIILWTEGGMKEDGEFKLEFNFEVEELFEHGEKHIAVSSTPGEVFAMMVGLEPHCS